MVYQNEPTGHNELESMEIQEQSDEVYKVLVMKALEVREKAYAPYSGFKVGAALIDDQNRIFTGCNIENASFGASNCAERTAIFSAISAGSKNIMVLAVVCDDNEYCRPCGICRQVMSEFANRNFCLLSVKPDGSYQKYSMDDLLPHAFRKFSSNVETL